MKMNEFQVGEKQAKKIAGKVGSKGCVKFNL